MTDYDVEEDFGALSADALLGTVTELTHESLAGLQVQKPTSRRDQINILIYGESGVGKTVLAGSASLVPEMSPVVMLDVEAGTLSLDKYYPNVDVIRIRRFQEIQDVYDELYHGRSKYKTVVGDSITELQKLGMSQIMKSPELEQMNLMPGSIPGLKEWGINTEQIRRLVRAFRDLEMHTIFTALVKDDKHPRTGAITMKPALSGQLAREVSAFLDIVGYMYTKNIQDGDSVTQARLLLTAPTDMQVAKDRTGRLSPIILEPTMTNIFNALTQ